MAEEDPFEVWRTACERAVQFVEVANFEVAADTAIEEAERLLALAYHLKGVACPACDGYGSRAYGSTATWRGGIGGQAITQDVCDKCWGTGRTDHTGPDLRALRATRK